MSEAEPQSAKSAVRLLAALLAAGKSVEEAAELVQISVEEVRALSAAPLFAVALSAEREAVAQRSVSLKGAVEQEGAATLAKLVALRDGADSEKVQLGAAQVLMDRVAPKRIEEERVVRLSLSAEAVAVLRGAARVAVKGSPALEERFATLEGVAKREEAQLHAERLLGVTPLSEALSAAEAAEREEQL